MVVVPVTIISYKLKCNKVAVFNFWFNILLPNDLVFCDWTSSSQPILNSSWNGLQSVNHLPSMMNGGQSTPKTFHKNILVNVEVYVYFRVLSHPRPKPFLYFTKQLTVKWFCSIPKWFFRWNEQVFFTNERKIFRSFIVPEGSPLIEASAVANIVNFQSLVGLVNLRDFNIIQFCIFFPCIDLFNGGVCWVFVAESLWFFYLSLWPVRHFEKLHRGACALPEVSGRGRLEPRKINVRRIEERVWYDTFVRFLSICKQ